MEGNGACRSVYKWVNSGGSFGDIPLRQQIGVASASRIVALEIYRPTTGKIDRFSNIPSDRCLDITEGAESYRELPYTPIPFPTGARLAGD
jgi:hypothetical protein